MGELLDDNTPVVVAYNLVHYESFHPVHKKDIEETIKLTNAYIAKPSRYEELYSFTSNDMAYLTSSSICNPIEETEIFQEEMAKTNHKKKLEDLADKGNLNNQHKPESFNKLAKFLFVKGSVKFEEIEEGKIQCGGCKEIFSRILGHLTKSIDCTRNIDLNEFKSKWTKFTQRKKDAIYHQKQKAENEVDFLKKKADIQKKCDQKQKAENEVNFLKTKADIQKKCDQKQKAENKVNFLKRKADKQKKCDQKQRVENDEIFLKTQAKKRKKSDEKQKAENVKSFMKAQRERRQKCDEK